MITNFHFSDVKFGRILNTLLEKDDLTDILVRPAEVKTNNKYPWKIFVIEISKEKYKLDLSQYSDEEVEELNGVIEKISTQLAIRMEVNFNEGSAILDAESKYMDKAFLRINSIHQSLTGGEEIPIIAIRKSPYGLRRNKAQMIQENFCSEEFFDLMEVLISSGCNIMISGSTGSGKTTTLKYLARYIKDSEGIITIEDTREAFLELLYPSKDIIPLKSTEHYGFESLVRTSMRQNPDWVLVSEIRGREVVDLMDSVSSGHHLISTVHAEGVDEIPYRMVNVAKLDGAGSERLYTQVYNDINIGIFIHYVNDERGSHRQIQELCEFYIDENGNRNCHMLYWWDLKEKCYKTDKIRSSKIIRKILRRETNTDKIGVFYDR